MRTREKLLDFFEENKGNYFSGEELAARLSVSRTAIWKAVNSLRKDGYEIDAIPNRGYCLSTDTDILSAQGVRKYLEPVCGPIKLEILTSTESTNDYLRGKALEGYKEGLTVIAGEQTGGRGRTGRSFYSPADTGIYMSLLLNPENCSPAKAVKFTTMAAVAACQAIEKVSQKKTQIKWVNDIYIEGKKVSGILTEGAVSLEKGTLEYVILGMGLNVYPPRDGFPRELEGTAGTVFREKKSDGKNRLAGEFLNGFMHFYTDWENAGYAREYRNRSLVLGKGIQVLNSAGARKARALDIDENCRLLVEYEDGSREWLRAGEISILSEQQNSF